jgi:amidase
MVISRCSWTVTRIGRFAIAVSLLGVTLDRTLLAFNYVVDANGTYWGIQDAASPGVDTGSIRATQIAPGGDNQPFSTQINGFGGIKVLVETSRPPRFNGELMRGFGLTFDGVDRFMTTTSVGLGGVTISRSVYVNRSGNYGRWLDSFTNTTHETLRIAVAFGGQSGIGTAATSTNVVATSSGDALVTPEDSWVEVATPLDGSTLVGGPQITVIGTPSSLSDPFSGAMTFAGNWLFDSFNAPLVYAGHEANFQAYVNTLTIPPGKSRSLLHFVVLGPRVDAATSAGERAEIEGAANGLVSAPDISGLTTAEVCTIRNFDVEALTASGFDYDRCSRRRGGTVDVVEQAPVPKAPKSKTTSDYDVVEKTIGQLRRDLERGRTTSREITRAYLDRIAVYDQGQFGFHAFEILAEDAMKQARAADQARARGAHGPLLGIPIAIKNNYDTFDMATTNGSFTFENFLPARDAFQVARLREAGAVIVGKTALEEYATFGHWSNDAWGQVWNVHLPSKSPLASSGGSAAAMAASFVAAAMGSQTGDSLYAPASGASLVTLRGTDGLESGTGIQPLVWMTDFGGAITRSVSDLADMLNIVTGIDPEDPATLARPAGAVPVDWRTVLDPNALQGKRIGYVDFAWSDVFGPATPPFGTNGTIDAMKNALQFLEKAGATLVQMGQLATPPTPDTPPAPLQPIPGNRITAEGWRQYIDQHPELITQGFSIVTEVDVNCSQKKVLYVRAAPETCAVEPLPRLTAAEIQQHRDYRQITRPAGVKQWMDDANVDAVVYPGLLSDISLNDGGGGGMGKVAFGRRDTPSAGNGVPTIAIPAGANNHGQPVNIQLMGRAWDDAKLVGFAYAFERLANAAGNGHVPARTVPTLRRGHDHDDDDDDHDRGHHPGNDGGDDDWDRWRQK